jgi:hypothetical protein
MPRFFVYALLLFSFLESSVTCFAQREERDLSNATWNAWLDRNAAWKDDRLYLPAEVKLGSLPVNSPSGRWEELFNSSHTKCHLPATFEQLFANGDPTWRYHGVGWFATEINLPTNWSDKRVRLSIGSARQRIEIYVNGRLAGYDAIPETPVVVDLTGFLKFGGTNRLALRITNAGGVRGWSDGPATQWGAVHLVASHDFGGIGGEVKLIATDPVYVDGLFVKNLLPAGSRSVEARIDLRNVLGHPVDADVSVEIYPYQSSGNILFRKDFRTSIQPGDSVVSQSFSVPDAKLWESDHPNLYTCHVSLKTHDHSDDTAVRFGFRTFEVKASSDGDPDYYLNGRRIRLRTAIDWGYYNHTGMFATPQQARRSVENAKAIGHNALSFHRSIGDPLVMDYADELGLLIYEEPGGGPSVDEFKTPSWIKTAQSDPSYFLSMSFIEKFERMVKRDRNHPSVIVYNIANESAEFGYPHRRIFDEFPVLDGTRMVVNQSGGQYGDNSGWVPHLRPYEDRPRLDLVDDHTVNSFSRFQESDLLSHRAPPMQALRYWGEVRCYAGPDNYYLLAQTPEAGSYDAQSYAKLAALTKEYFERNQLSRFFASPADLTRQAGRGLMYIDGRLGQSIMTQNEEDGYAINGWSDGDLSLGDDILSWYSGLTDSARNLKGPAADMAYWTRDLQIAILRKNGKYFKPGETAHFEVHLINEGRLTGGPAELRISFLDGSGQLQGGATSKWIEVAGGDTYAQLLIPNLAVQMSPQWRGGYITVKAELRRSEHQVAEGAEQVLLQNRTSFSPLLHGKTIAVYQWPAAESAIREAHGSIVQVSHSAMKHGNVIVAGDAPEASLLNLMLVQVRQGARLIVRFDPKWADALLHAGVLSKPVTIWGGEQKGYWNGNGWGYLTHFVSSQSIPSGATIGTNSWEVPEDPKGFAPFESSYPQTSYGAQFRRPDQLLTLLGSVQYGKGEILLAPGYAVDLNNAFTDLLLFKMISEDQGIKEPQIQ